MASEPEEITDSGHQGRVQLAVGRGAKLNAQSLRGAFYRRPNPKQPGRRKKDVPRSELSRGLIEFCWRH
jgi:hypothetical protein